MKQTTLAKTKKVPMDHETIVRLIKIWRRNFFMEPTLLSVLIFSFIVSILYHQREKERVFFLFYFLVGILLFAIISPISVLKIIYGRKGDIINEMSNTIFELAEFVAFYYFFKGSLQNKKSRKILRSFLISLFIIVGAFFIALSFPKYTATDIRKHSLFINVIEFFFLFIMCLAYFFELFTNAPKINISQRPSFLIVTGAFFYSALMIPFFMLANDMLQFEASTYHLLFTFHFVLLIIMLTAISKAFLCKIRITI
jgi:hypothetical protein